MTFVVSPKTLLVFLKSSDFVQCLNNYLTKFILFSVFSNSLPSNVELAEVDYISSDFSYTSSVTSSHSVLGNKYNNKKKLK